MFLREVKKKIKSPNFLLDLFLLNKIEFISCFQPIHHLSSYLYSFKTLSLFSLSKDRTFDFNSLEKKLFRFSFGNGEERWDFGYGHLFPSDLCSTGENPKFFLFFFDVIYFFLRLIGAIAFILCFCRSFQRFLYCKINTLISKISFWIRPLTFDFINLRKLMNFFWKESIQAKSYKIFRQTFGSYFVSGFCNAAEFGTRWSQKMLKVDFVF